MHDDDDDDGDRGDGTVVVTVTVMVLVEMVKLMPTVMMFEALEWFSIECCKTKTKINYSDQSKLNELIRIQCKYMWQVPSMGNVCNQHKIGFGLASNWLRK